MSTLRTLLRVFAGCLLLPGVAAATADCTGRFPSGDDAWVPFPNWNGDLPDIDGATLGAPPCASSQTCLHAGGSGPSTRYACADRPSGYGFGAALGGEGEQVADDDRWRVWHVVGPSGTALHCNEVVPAKLYVRKASRQPEDAGWIVFLDGGGGCRTPPECATRGGQNVRGLPAGQRPCAAGICAGAGYWRQSFNFAYLPYCSSDLFSGLGAEPGPEGRDPYTGFYLEGVQILENALRMLANRHPVAPKLFIDGTPMVMGDNRRLVIAGASAGAVAVRWQSDRIARLVRSPALAGGFGLAGVRVYAVGDSVMTGVDVSPHDPAEREFLFYSRALHEQCLEAHPDDPGICRDVAHLSTGFGRDHSQWDSTNPALPDDGGHWGASGMLDGTLFMMRVRDLSARKEDSGICVRVECAPGEPGCVRGVQWSSQGTCVASAPCDHLTNPAWPTCWDDAGAGAEGYCGYVLGDEQTFGLAHVNQCDSVVIGDDEYVPNPADGGNRCAPTDKCISGHCVAAADWNRGCATDAECDDLVAGTTCTTSNSQLPDGFCIAPWAAVASADLCPKGATFDPADGLCHWRRACGGARGACGLAGERCLRDDPAIAGSKGHCVSEPQCREGLYDVTFDAGFCGVAPGRCRSNSQCVAGTVCLKAEEAGAQLPHNHERFQRIERDWLVTTALDAQPGANGYVLLRQSPKHTEILGSAFVAVREFVTNPGEPVPIVVRESLSGILQAMMERGASPTFVENHP